MLGSVAEIGISLLISTNTFVHPKESRDFDMTSNSFSASGGLLTGRRGV
jgi:hypothetical protein